MVYDRFNPSPRPTRGISSTYFYARAFCANGINISQSQKIRVSDQINLKHTAIRGKNNINGELA